MAIPRSEILPLGVVIVPPVTTPFIVKMYCYDSANVPTDIPSGVPVVNCVNGSGTSLSSRVTLGPNSGHPGVGQYEWYFTPTTADLGMIQSVGFYLSDGIVGGFRDGTVFTLDGYTSQILTAVQSGQ